ncbi:hypothetical protein HDU76_006379, partial [Blyttiomyces sp. JEL0837]
MHQRTNDRGPPFQQQGAASTFVSTLTVTSTITPGSNPSPATPSRYPTGSGATSSNVTIISAVTAAGVVCLFAILGLAWYVRRRDKLKNNELIAMETALPTQGTSDNNQPSNQITDPSSTSEAPALPDLNIEKDEAATAQWLPEIHPATQQTLFAKQSNSNVNNDAKLNVTSGSATVTREAKLSTKGSTTVIGNSQSQAQGLDEKFSQEIEPRMQRFIVSEIVRENAPTSNINLENHLQRLYGTYGSWTHELVMEWARRKRVDPAVVEILRSYRIDGPLLATLDIHSLKEKCDVQDFRLRAKFIQAVEFLKDSSQVIANSTVINDTDGEGLPQCEGNGDVNA